ncbi:YbhN family protein [Rhizobium sp. YIM 134829]|uniref:lysylphosphatidylglycerol synthase transmembrane domain-containing protein n=1 Tax=Rhizobium sp. YIM 134829 TaxID=3390453 RepID=UPI003979D0E7
MSSLRIVAPLLVLVLAGWLLLTVDLAALRQALAQVSMASVAAGLALVQGQIWLSALRWRFTAARLGQEISLGRAIGEYYVASLLNLSLPGGMAGDALRAYRLRGGGAGGWKAPAKAVLFERLSGQGAFLLVALTGLLFWPRMVAPPDLSLGAGPLTLGALIVLLSVILALRLAVRRSAFVAATARDLAQVFVKDGAWAVQLGLSLLVVSLYGVTFFIASRAVGAPLPLEALLTIIPLALLAMLIPSGLGGWGTREAAAMALWPLLGSTSAQGLAASLLYGALSLAGALPGLGLLVWQALRRRNQRS